MQTVRGVIDLEAILLPADEVRERPAGVGRDEPNQDPFLDPNDPHLVAHRSRFSATNEKIRYETMVAKGLLGMKLREWSGIANLKIVKSAKALAGGLLAGAQLLLMLKLIAMGASGLFAAIMSQDDQHVQRPSGIGFETAEPLMCLPSTWPKCQNASGHGRYEQYEFVNQHFPCLDMKRVPHDSLREVPGKASLGATRGAP
eukprot:s839_g22.t1